MTNRDQQIHELSQSLYQLKRMHSKMFINKDINCEISPPDMMVLIEISMMNKQKPVQMNAIAEHFNFSRAAATQLIRKLEDKGLIERVFSDEDRRSVFIKLTKNAFDEMAIARKGLESSIEELYKIIGEKDINNLIRIITKLNDYAIKKGEENG